MKPNEYERNTKPDLYRIGLKTNVCYGLDDHTQLALAIHECKILVEIKISTKILLKILAKILPTKKILGQNLWKKQNSCPKSWQKTNFLNKMLAKNKILQQNHELRTQNHEQKNKITSQKNKIIAKMLDLQKARIAAR